MTDTRSIKSLILELGGADSIRRDAAASALFHQGLELARPTVGLWMGDPEFKRILIFASPGFPSATVGIAVEANNFECIRAANGSPSLADVPPDQDAQEFELHFGREIRLDVLTTREPEGAGAIARFLKKFGEGVQQIELMVRNVDRATEILRAQFCQAPIYPSTRAGAGGTRVNFFLAATPGGKKVLIELVEVGHRKT